jgi:small subunit ribosomal protein S20
VLPASLCECAAARASALSNALTSTGRLSRLPAPALPGTMKSGDFVANTKSAEKAAHQAEKHRARNVALRSRMRTAVRGVSAAIAGGDKEAARVTYQRAVPVIDSLVGKQIIHRNKAARHKSRLAARIRAMQ